MKKNQKVKTISKNSLEFTFYYFLYNLLLIPSAYYLSNKLSGYYNLIPLENFSQGFFILPILSIILFGFLIKNKQNENQTSFVDIFIFFLFIAPLCVLSLFINPGIQFKINSLLLLFGILISEIINRSFLNNSRTIKFPNLSNKNIKLIGFVVSFIILILLIQTGNINMKSLSLDPLRQITERSDLDFNRRAITIGFENLRQIFIYLIAPTCAMFNILRYQLRKRKIYFIGFIIPLILIGSISLTSGSKFNILIAFIVFMISTLISKIYTIPKINKYYFRGLNKKLIFALIFIVGIPSLFQMLI